MKKIAVINFENASEKDSEGFGIRNTARGVVFDEDNNIALMKVSKNKFYKLPGGGMKKGETYNMTFIRECREEAGVEIGTLTELGLITEIKKCNGVVQNSCCYLAYVVGKKNNPSFTELEKKNGFSVIWVGIDEAIKYVKKAGFSNLIGRYVSERELIILELAKKYSNQNI